MGSILKFYPARNGGGGASDGPQVGAVDGRWRQDIAETRKLVELAASASQPLVTLVGAWTTTKQVNC